MRYVLMKNGLKCLKFEEYKAHVLALRANPKLFLEG